MNEGKPKDPSDRRQMLVPHGRGMSFQWGKKKPAASPEGETDRHKIMNRECF